MMIQVDGFVISNFDQNHTSERVLIQNYEIWNLNGKKIFGKRILDKMFERR